MRSQRFIGNNWIFGGQFIQSLRRSNETILYATNGSKSMLTFRLNFRMTNIVPEEVLGRGSPFLDQ